MSLRIPKHLGKLPEPVPSPAASAPMSDFSAPPPPMLRDSSEFQTIVSAGTNPLDQIYKNSKQRELGEKQNPLSRAYEGHCSTRLRSRSPPAHSASYSSSRHQSRSPGPRQASIDRPGGNGSLSRAYDEHQLRQVYNFWRFLPLHRGVFCQVPFRLIYYCHSSKSTGK